MGALLPLPQIIFYLALLFLPQGVLEFSTTIDGSQITWTRANAGWQAEGGTWSVKGTAVSSSCETTDVGKLVSVQESNAGGKSASVKGKPVAVSLGEGTITLSQATGGVLANPVVITYTREGAPK